MSNENEDGEKKAVAANPIGYSSSTMTLKDPFMKSITLTASLSGWLLYLAYSKRAHLVNKSKAYWLSATALGLFFANTVGYYAIRKIAAGGTLSNKFKNSSDLKEKLVVVTGGTAGIGKFSVIQLLKWGAKVYIGCRDAEKAKRVSIEIKKAANLPEDSSQVQFFALDLLDLASVKDFANTILEKNEGIDILLNNAGAMLPAKFDVTKDGFEQLVGCNHLSHFLLTLLLLDNIKKQNGRIITVSSLAHTSAGYNSTLTWEQVLTVNASNYKSYKFYGISKLFNIWFTRELQKRLNEDSQTTATAYCNHPGVVKTELVRNAPAIVRFLYARMDIFFKNPEEGAATQLYLCAAPKEDLTPGLYYDNCKLGSVTPLVLNEEKSQEMWDRSMELVSPFL